MGRKKSFRRNKEKDFVSHGMMRRTIIIPILVFTVAVCMLLFKNITKTRSTYEGIEYIASMQTSPGRLNDYQNKLLMHDPATDIKWFMIEEDGVIEIDYGIEVLTWEYADFFTDANAQHLAKIGFSFSTDVGTNKLHIYYNGVEVERCYK